MHDGSEGWGGRVEDTTEALASACEALSRDPLEWHRAQADGRRLLSALYSREANLEIVREALQSRLDNLSGHRSLDFHGATLWQESARSTEYFSRWIELKEAKLESRAKT